jgi:phosphoribosylaminoimidazole carboxylase PurE protein
MIMKKQAPLLIVMGSDSDLPILKECFDVLKQFKISFEATVLSAHRTPDDVALLAKTARKRGVKVIIAGAGGAAHLAGVVAAHTTLPVIGIPLDSSSLHGLDALLSTVQMPAGVPVATVAIGKAGAVNAALLSVQILSLSDKRIEALLDDYKKMVIKKVHAKNVELKKMIQ